MKVTVSYMEQDGSFKPAVTFTLEKGNPPGVVMKVLDESRKNAAHSYLNSPVSLAHLPDRKPDDPMAVMVYEDPVKWLQNFKRQHGRVGHLEILEEGMGVSGDETGGDGPPEHPGKRLPKLKG